MPYLFQVSLGPVQSFIAGARRTRDLTFGSRLMSELAKTVALSLAHSYRPQRLIFPAFPEGIPLKVVTLEDVPNKILALIDASSDEEVTALADSLKQEIEAALIQVKEEVSRRIRQRWIKERSSSEDARWARLWDGIIREVGESFEDGVAWLQLRDFFEYSWVAVAFDPTAASDGYFQARKTLEALLAARKNTRAFHQPDGWGSDQPKSSLDGQFECVIPKAAYPQRRSGQKTFPKDPPTLTALRQVFGVGPHEKLSGIDLLKRLGPMRLHNETAAKNEPAEVETFPSTSHMAALPFLRGLKNLPEKEYAQAAHALSLYIQELRALRDIPFRLDVLPREYQQNAYWTTIHSLGEYDGALLFPERFPDIVDDTQTFERERQRFEHAVSVLKEQVLGPLSFKPTPYYALLVADGDSMGKVLDHQAKQPNGWVRHQQLSRALTTFANEARNVVRDQSGVCIYAGGDDVMALLPLHTAVQCAYALARLFEKTMQSVQDGDGKSPTLSVGLAVVHHVHPLGDALNIARSAEKRAKTGTKNALAITVQKRGGPPCEIRGQWDVFYPRLERLITLSQEGLIPSGMAYELQEIALRLEPSDHLSTSPGHVQYAALRVFQRKLSETNAGRGEKTVRDQTLKTLKGMIGLGEERKTDAAGAIVSVGTLADELVVARLFAGARRIAGNDEEVQHDRMEH